jgi:hypothetical protein
MFALVTVEDGVVANGGQSRVVGEVEAAGTKCRRRRPVVAKAVKIEIPKSQFYDHDFNLFDCFSAKIRQFY